MPSNDAETIAEIRRGEALASAALIGAELVCLEFRDLPIFNHDESRGKVVEALRRTSITRAGRLRSSTMGSLDGP